MLSPFKLPEDLQQQLSVYCQEHRLPEEAVVRLALERFFLAVSEPPTPYELGKRGFGSDETHAGDIARNTKALLRGHIGRDLG